MDIKEHVIYRVKKQVKTGGEIVFKVEAADSFLLGFLGIWSEYSKENKTLDEAIGQIKFLATLKRVSEKVVYKIKWKDIK